MSSLSSALVAAKLPPDLDAAPFGDLTLAVLLEAISWMAFPIYAWLLCSGFRHTHDRLRYGVRLGVLAVVSEVPYDLATSGRFWDMSSQNPVFALLTALVVMAALRFLEQYAPLARVLASICVTVAGVTWLVLFNVGMRFGLMPGGIVLFAMTLVFYLLEKRINTMMLTAGVIGALALVFPALGLVVLHFRNGEAAPKKIRTFFYAAYPIVLATAGVLGLVF
ncbi:MAG: conjugal transfer protein TraX [Propionibacteriaceae bacterium]|nr:conjugal transfer protein TraX [Propionibacteriaceae bacterium]